MLQMSQDLDHGLVRIYVFRTLTSHIKFFVETPPGRLIFVETPAVKIGGAFQHQLLMNLKYRCSGIAGPNPNPFGPFCLILVPFEVRWPNMPKFLKNARFLDFSQNLHFFGRDIKKTSNELRFKNNGPNVLGLKPKWSHASIFFVADI